MKEKTEEKKKKKKGEKGKKNKRSFGERRYGLSTMFKPLKNGEAGVMRGWKKGILFI